jgi:hypothetical protein
MMTAGGKEDGSCELGSSCQNTSKEKISKLEIDFV